MQYHDYLRWRQCTGKFPHLTRQAAVDEADRLRRIKKVPTHIHFNAYRCCFCHRYHVGRSPEDDYFSEWVAGQ